MQVLYGSFNRIDFRLEMILHCAGRQLRKFGDFCHRRADVAELNDALQCGNDDAIASECAFFLLVQRIHRQALKNTQSEIARGSSAACAFTKLLQSPARVIVLPVTRPKAQVARYTTASAMSRIVKTSRIFFDLALPSHVEFSALYHCQAPGWTA
jgi:hypothetical protein